MLPRPLASGRGFSFPLDLIVLLTDTESVRITTMTPTQTQEAPKGTNSADSFIRKMVSLNALTEDPRLQVRGGLNPEKVAEYTAIIREHGSMDPLDVFYQDPITPQTVFLVADGFHRKKGYELAEVEKVPCKLRIGDISDALEFSLRKNGRHGAQMSNEEKRCAAKRAVEDPRLGQKSDIEIAKLMGCSATLVASVRRGDTPQQETQRRRKREKTEPEEASFVPPPQTVEVSAHERKAPGTKTPTKASILRQVRDYLFSDVISEQDLTKLMESETEEYRWVPKPGGVTTLKVVGKTGRTQIEIPVVVKLIENEGITLKFEGGKVSVEEA